MRELSDQEILSVFSKFTIFLDTPWQKVQLARELLAASAARAEGPETVDERAAFEREHDRYFVIKRKDLDIDQLRDLTAFIDHGDIPTRQCVVVEEDWPEYEPVWAMIEARMTGRAALATAPTMSEAARTLSTEEARRIYDAACLAVTQRKFVALTFDAWCSEFIPALLTEIQRIDRAAAKGESDEQ